MPFKLSNSNIKLLFLFYLIISFYSCVKSTDSEGIGSVNSNATEYSDSEFAESTREMATLIDDIYSKIDPANIAYFSNGTRAEMMKNRYESTKDPSKQLLLKMRYGMELISAGKNENAIIVLEQVLSGFDQIKFNDLQQIFRCYRALAIAYLRVGEIQNCLNGINEFSCIVPLSKEAEYKDKRSVKTAISILNKMLKLSPVNEEAIWLLNFAHMASGDYPDGVPAEFLIQQNNFESEYDIDRFKNIGPQKKIDINGLAGGAIMDDFNNDGFLDLISTSWSGKEGIHYFQNNGKGEFIDFTYKAGLKGLKGGLNINQVDYNNDGFLDLYVMRGAWYSADGKIPNSLLRNDGNGKFTDVTKELGLLSFNPTQTSIWQDFNLDGRIDLFVANESNSRYVCNNELFIQNSTGRFENVIGSIEGLENSSGFAKGSSAGDINNDGLVDIYISYNGAPNKLFLNTSKNGQLSFKDISKSAKTEQPLTSFPTWFWDFNNDGYDDIFVGDFGDFTQPKVLHVVKNYQGEATGYNPKIYLNNKDNTFTESSKSLGVTDALFAMGSNYGDIDNDGFLDFYLATGSPNFTSIFPNRMFRNAKGEKFQDVTTAGGFGHIQKGHGVAFGDLDNDGDQDVFCVLGGAYDGDVAKDALFLNPGNENSWLSLKLIGHTSNRAAIGAKVQIKYTNSSGVQQNQFHTISSGSSFGGNSLILELGLADATKINEVIISWPNSKKEKSIHKNLELNTKYHIFEENSKVVKKEISPVLLDSPSE